jgi:hypothetical protein
MTVQLAGPTLVPRASGVEPAVARVACRLPVGREGRSWAWVGPISLDRWDRRAAGGT